MRWLLLILLAPSVALAAGPRVISGSGTISTGPRIMGEAAFAFELDALTQEETSRGGWQVTTTRAGGATCIAGHSVAANVACISAGGLECFASGVGGRTAMDRHTASTAGWPTAGGDIRFQLTPSWSAPPADAHLLDTRIAAADGLRVYFSSTGALRFGTGNGGNFINATISWVAGQAYEIRAVWGGGSLTLYRDGVQVGTTTGAMMPTAHGVAALGSAYSGTLTANGSIRLIRVSQ